MSRWIFFSMFCLLIPTMGQQIVFHAGGDEQPAEQVPQPVEVPKMPPEQSEPEPSWGPCYACPVSPCETNQTLKSCLLQPGQKMFHEDWIRRKHKVRWDRLAIKNGRHQENSDSWITPRWPIKEKPRYHREANRLSTVYACERADLLRQQVLEYIQDAGGDVERAQPSWETPPNTSPVHTINASTRTLSVGTDCSGIEAPIQALRNLKVSFKHKFSSDIDQHVKAMIQANFEPDQFYTDMIQRDVKKAPSVDLYIAGFPCQPFSVAGKRQGFDDGKGRGNVIQHIIQYLTENSRKCLSLKM